MDKYIDKQIDKYRYLERQIDMQRKGRQINKQKDRQING